MSAMMAEQYLAKEGKLASRADFAAVIAAVPNRPVTETDMLPAAKAKRRLK